MSATATPMAPVSSHLTRWAFIDIDDAEVPDGILTALEAARRDIAQGYVGTIICGDMLLYHGEDGWVLGDETLAIAEAWLEQHRSMHGFDEQTCFWVRIKIT